VLELRRLRLLRELHERGTIAAVADALQFTPSAVSQSLNMLEREAGVPLLERAGRGVRLTDAALVLVSHAEALLDRAARAEADLAAAAGVVAGRARIAGFQSVMLTLALPAVEQLAQTAPRLRTELTEAEPEDALPALSLGDLDLVIGDEWEHQPLQMPSGVTRHELFADPVNLLVAPGGPATVAELAQAHWATGFAGMAWDEMTRRTCRALGGFDPDVRHRCSDATLAVALVRRGLAVTLLPALPLRGVTGVDRHPIGTDRAIFAATRSADATRPSTQAVLQAIRSTALPAT
jgi:DNA-binding transcriptional LysR family regulator